MSDALSDLQHDRHIRVFISSTFRDMGAERDHLVKFVFPQLRKLCESRGVTWGEVDLRWGVTDEAAAEGKVLPICLEEINRCNPYFIGLLGERYGWIPQSISDDLVAQQPWLKEHRNKSVTELEIVHGVLRNEVMHQHAYFYFRDPKMVVGVPDEKKADFMAESAEHGEKLKRLKTDIRRACDEQVCRIRECYASPEELGEWVLEDFTKLINDLYPEGSKPDPLDREAADHEAFARSRARVYIGRQEYFDRLDDHAAGNDAPLVVIGESGSGKSSLLANWALRHLAEHSGDLLLLHFIGGTPHSSNWAAMLRRIMAEFKRRFGIEQEIPNHPDALRPAFANWLSMASARSRIVIILDALNQLEDHDGAPDLVWLPPVIPDNVRLILSTLPGRALDDLQKRRWPVLEIEALNQVERGQLIGQYLAQHSKALSPDRAKRIAAAPQSANPLFLRALLEELRVFGQHERLDERIGHYLNAETIPALYVLILARWEADYDGDTKLVSNAMTLLWSARRGLTENELLRALGTDGEPLPRAAWSPLFLTIEDSLISRDGLLTFFHDYLREAVQTAYIPRENDQRAAHLRLAEFFTPESSSPRKIEELPWHLTQAAAWTKLCDLLSDLSFFEAFWQFNPFDARACWARLEENGFSARAAYRLDETQSFNVNILHSLSILLDSIGHPAEAFNLSIQLAQCFREIGDSANHAVILGSCARHLYNLGDLDEAMKLFQQVEMSFRELGNMSGLMESLIDQANLFRTRGDLDGAMEILRKAESIVREFGNERGLAGCLCNQANVLMDRGDLTGALALLKQSEQINRELGDRDGLVSCFVSQANILRIRGDLQGAITLLKQAEHKCRELGNRKNLASVLGHEALILRVRGDLCGAKSLHDQEVQICTDLNHKDSLQSALGNQALVLMDQGCLDTAMEQLMQAEQICREIGNQNALANWLGNHAGILIKRGDRESAMPFLIEAEQICRKLGAKEILQFILGIKGKVRELEGDPSGAIALFEEKEKICRELGNSHDLEESLSAQITLMARKAVFLLSQGDSGEALALLKQQEQFCEQLNDKSSLRQSLGIQSIILEGIGDLGGALVTRKREEHICRNEGDVAGLQQALRMQLLLLMKLRSNSVSSVGVQETRESLRHSSVRVEDSTYTLILHPPSNDGTYHLAFHTKDTQSHGEFSLQQVSMSTVNDLDGKLGILKQAEQRCRELRNEGALQACLSTQAIILSELDGGRALTLLKEAETICRGMGAKTALQACLANQAVILYAAGNFKGALELHEEEERICRETDNQNGLQGCFANQAKVLNACGDADHALELFRKAEQICREINNQDGLQVCLGSHALVLDAQGLHREAIALLQQKERICRDSGNSRGLVIALTNHAGIVARNMPKPEQALSLLEEVATLLSSAPDLPELAVQLQTIGGNILQVIHERQLHTKETNSEKANRATSIYNNGLVLRDRGDIDHALVLLREAEKLYDEAGEKSGLAASLGKQAEIFKSQGDVDGAFTLYDRAEQIYRELPKKSKLRLQGLRATVGQQGLILEQRGDLDSALQKYQEVQQICRNAADATGLAASLVNQASILAWKMANPREAFPLIMQAYWVAVNHNLVEMASSCKSLRDSACNLLRKQGMGDIEIHLLEEIGRAAANSSFSKKPWWKCW